MCIRDSSRERQEKAQPCFIPLPMNGAEAGSAVSYTHLDVYKRQNGWYDMNYKDQVRPGYDMDAGSVRVQRNHDIARGVPTGGNRGDGRVVDIFHGLF